MIRRFRILFLQIMAMLAPEDLRLQATKELYIIRGKRKLR
jgi:hypothetical protein